MPYVAIRFRQCFQSCSRNFLQPLMPCQNQYLFLLHLLSNKFHECRHLFANDKLLTFFLHLICIDFLHKQFPDYFLVILRTLRWENSDCTIPDHLFLQQECTVYLIHQATVESELSLRAFLSGCKLETLAWLSSECFQFAFHKILQADVLPYRLSENQQRVH